MVSKLNSKHFWGVAVWFGTDFTPLERFWSHFKKNEKIEISKIFCFIFKHILCMNAYQNSRICDFLNFFSKMKPLIKNPER